MKQLNVFMNLALAKQTSSFLIIKETDTVSEYQSPVSVGCQKCSEVVLVLCESPNDCFDSFVPDEP